MKISVDGVEYTIKYAHDSQKGFTICFLVDAKGRRTLGSHITDADAQFSRARGRKKALAEAIQKKFARAQRKAVWDAIFVTRANVLSPQRIKFLNILSINFLIKLKEKSIPAAVRSGEKIIAAQWTV